MGNVDVGRAEYLGLPYYGRWLLSVARILVEKHHIGLTELTERMAEVTSRYAGGLNGRTIEAQPKFEGDGSGGSAQRPPRARRRQGRPAGVRRAGRHSRLRRR